MFRHPRVQLFSANLLLASFFVQLGCGRSSRLPSGFNSGLFGFPGPSQSNGLPGNGTDPFANNPLNTTPLSPNTIPNPDFRFTQFTPQNDGGTNYGGGFGPSGVLPTQAINPFGAPGLSVNPSPIGAGSNINPFRQNSFGPQGMNGWGGFNPIVSYTNPQSNPNTMWHPNPNSPPITYPFNPPNPNDPRFNPNLNPNVSQFNAEFCNAAVSQDIPPLRAYIISLFMTVLGRMPRPDEIQYYMSGSLRSIATAIVRSQENAINTVSANYRTFLGRAPEPGGLGHWVALVLQQSPEDAIKGIAASDEAYSRVGQNVQEFARSLYRRILGREGEQAGLNYWFQALQNGDATRRLMVANSFLASNEYRHRIVTSLFMGYLLRAPSQSELEQYKNLMNGSQGSHTPQIEILSSQEYFNRIVPYIQLMAYAMCVQGSFGG